MNKKTSKGSISSKFATLNTRKEDVKKGTEENQVLARVWANGESALKANKK